MIKKMILFFVVILLPFTAFAGEVQIQKIEMMPHVIESSQSGADGVLVQIKVALDKNSYPWQTTQVELCFELLNKINCQQAPWPLLDSYIMFKKHVAYRDYAIKSGPQQMNLKNISIKILNQVDIFEKQKVVQTFNNKGVLMSAQLEWPDTVILSLRGHGLKLHADKIKNLTFENHQGKIDDTSHIQVIYPFGEKKAFAGHQESKVCLKSDCELQFESKPFRMSKKDVLHFWIIAQRKEISRNWLLGDLINRTFADQTMLAHIEIPVENLLKNKNYVFSNEFVKEFIIELDASKK